MVGPLRAPYLSTTTKRLTSKGRPARGSGADPGVLRTRSLRLGTQHPSLYRRHRMLAHRTHQFRLCRKDRHVFLDVCGRSRLTIAVG